ncbi:MAG: hypothetical protein ACI8ZB_003080, partial [Desulforhopalus sp.]
SRSSPYFFIKAPIKIYLGWGFFVLYRYCKKDPPVPIPYTQVNFFRSLTSFAYLPPDGTAWATVWESRSSPYFFIKAPIKIYLGWGFFVLYRYCKKDPPVPIPYTQVNSFGVSLRSLTCRLMVLHGRLCGRVGHRRIF